MDQAIKQRPNPQGKGSLQVLDSLNLPIQNLCVPAKNIERIADELFTSLFILNSQIRFKPVIGQSYWLYRQQKGYRLSLIAPEQWAPEKFGSFIGVCELHADLTWSLELSRDSQNDALLLAEIKQKRALFNQNMLRSGQIEAALPVYEQSLPFYSRVLAFSLAHSLKQSMHKSGILGLNYRQAQQQSDLKKTRGLLLKDDETQN